MRHYSELEDLERIIVNDNITVVNLQYGRIDDSLSSLTEEARSKIFLPECDLKNNMDDVFAIIKNCDLIICPTTSLMIQGAALGVETISYAPVYPFASLNFERYSTEIFRHPWLNSVEIYKIQNGNKADVIKKISDRVIGKYS